ncbi:DUF3365 domain-containing protein [Cytophagaceae bacterium ABcell3]|nr:DUF3365 domain-containing protein [Cytophagaceae bacterium ABcell3]
MKEKHILTSTLLLVLAIVIHACQTTTEKENNNLSLEEKQKAVGLFQDGCASCHSLTSSEKQIAPAMDEIRKAYWSNSQTEFSSKMTKFILAPSEELSMIKKAVEKYGIMPKIPFKEEDIMLVSKLIHETDFKTLKEEDWLALSKKNNISEDSISYEEKGRKIANGTKATLGKNLMKAIHEGGSVYAVEFCNTKAIALTDSMAGAYKALVKRVSDKPRNPENMATNDELKILNTFKEKLAKGHKNITEVQTQNELVTAYYSIETNQMCLQCHGKPQKDIAPETFTKINKLYPNDKAVGYDEGQVRGMFVVEFEKGQ